MNLVTPKRTADIPSQKAREIPSECHTAEVPVATSATVARTAAVQDAQTRDFGLFGKSASNPLMANGNTVRNPMIQSSDSPLFSTPKFAATPKAAFTVRTYATAEAAVAANSELRPPLRKPSFQCLDKARLPDAEKTSRT